jgi:uncharacterized membrane protein YfcA
MLVAINVFFTALIFSMFGMGGGLFYMPLFLVFFESFREASTLSFLCIFLTSLSAMIAYHQEKLIDWRLLLFLGIPLATATLITGFFLSCVTVALLKTILGVTLFLAGISMLTPSHNHLFFGKLQTVLQKLHADDHYCISPLLLSPLTFIIGLFAGTAGVAGGVFHIPLMVTMLRISAHVAVATSSAIIALASCTGWIGRLVSNGIAFIDGAELLIILLCAFFGAHIGPKISIRLHRVLFKKVCGICIVLIGVWYMVKGLQPYAGF